MKTRIFLLLLFVSMGCKPSRSQPHPDPKLVGTCQGCEAVLEFGSRTLAAVDTLPDFATGPDPMRLEGTVYLKDGRTPAAGVVIYAYHTDSVGVYPTRGGESGWARYHGYIRGWVKTDENGRYMFYTSKPGHYPSGGAPAHIHMIVMEPDGKYYWIDDCFFEGDPYLRPSMRNGSPRGGFSGILVLRAEGRMHVGERNIILGRNVDGHE